MALKTALVVDDSKSARKMLQKLLIKKSLDTDAVENGEEAIEYLQGRQTYPDVIFMDHMMPGMNGLETSKQISDTPEMDSIPIVMFTSKEDADYIEVARAHGASAVLRKPLSPSELDEVIQYINELTEQAADAVTSAQPEEDQDMQAATQLPEIDYEAIESMAKQAADTTAREAVASSVPEMLAQQMPAFKEAIVAEFPKAEDTSGMRDEIRSLQEQVETLQGRLAAVVETMQALQADTDLSDELKQQIVSTAETSAAAASTEIAATIAADVAEKVATSAVQAKQAETVQGVTTVTDAEYRHVKLFASVSLGAALVALIMAIF